MIRIFSKPFKITSSFLSCFSVRNIGQLIHASDSQVLKSFEKTLLIKEDFLSNEEEESLLEEVDPYMKKLRYEYDHWDNVICGYRETERLKWLPKNQEILNRVKKFAFDSFEGTNNSKAPKSNLLNHVHILDLSENGYILPHVDAVRFCGNTIAGLCLLSDAVMRLINEKDKTLTATILLKRRCLYIMRENARYEYAHEVLKNEDSYFMGQHIKKTRRISIICRNEPE